jgi:hypothetical protein
MNKFTGKFEKLHEETLYRYQQGGFLRGDYVKIKKDALKNESIGQFSDQMKSIIQDAIKNETTLRVSYIKSGRTESYSGPVDAANIPSCTLWADCYVEHAPGMWHNVMTIPLSILEKIEVEGANGFAPYDKNLVRPNTDEPDRMDKELKSQTLGDDENRKNAKKNTKLANTKEPKDGRKQTPFKEGVELGKENGFMFESYLNSLLDESTDIDAMKKFFDMIGVDVVQATPPSSDSKFSRLFANPNATWDDLFNMIKGILGDNIYNWTKSDIYGMLTKAGVSPNDINYVMDMDPVKRMERG